MLAETTKDCSRCGEVKPASEFNLQLHGRGGRRSYCRQCQSLERAAYYRRRSTYEQEKYKKWARDNPNKRAQKDLLRAERLRNAPGGPYDPARYAGRAALYDGLCGYCQAAPYETWDHMIPVSRGGSNFPSNMMPACRRCNLTKNNKKFRFEWLPERLRPSQFIQPATVSIRNPQP